MTRHTIVTDKVAALSAKYNIPGEWVHVLLGELLEIIHETTFKGSPTDALLGVRFSLGPEAAWHFFGIIYDSLKGSDTELISDQRHLWYETITHMFGDGEMKDYAAGILERWSTEKSDELA